MTIDSAYFPEKRNNHGGTMYQFEFEVIDPAYVRVFAIDAQDVYTLIDPADYTVTVGTYIAPISRGGIITFLVPLAAAVVAISVQRKTDLIDTQTFPTGQAFNAESFEFQADKLTMILQEINAEVCDCSGGDPGYDPDAYLTELIRVVDSGTNGGVYILDEALVTGDPIDVSRFSNDLVNFGSPFINQTSFLDDGRTATNVQSTLGYRNSITGGLPLSGTFGCIHEANGGLALRSIDVSHGTNALSLSTNPLTTQIGYSLGTQYHTWGGSQTGVLYIIYSITGLSTIVSELIRNFVSEGQQTTTGGTYSTSGTDDFRIGSTGGTGQSKVQYAFWSDRQFTAVDIAALNLAYQRNFSSYVPP